ncbi:MAG: hypothetical protein JXX14_04430 [Deltaproteobacteria bacterium]|nr:hypothetical protein [Deltaproteobacteria bacterium]
MTQMWVWPWAHILDIPRRTSHSISTKAEKYSVTPNAHSRTDSNPPIGN